jgi:DNA-binding transcriptional MerR regulator
MRIGEVAAAAGVSPRALRYYEEQGLLTSIRTPSGQRHYGEGAVERVRWIQALYAAGLSSKAITGLLPCVHTGIATEAMLEQLAVERDRIDSQIRDLTATRDRLDSVIAAASNPSDDCAVRGPVAAGSNALDTDQNPGSLKTIVVTA